MRIKFIKSGANTAIGAFGPGDTANTSDELAQHLVDSGVAEFFEAKSGGGKVKPGDEPVGLRSAGLTVTQIKEALEARKIEIPAGVTRKDDLAALLDGAPQD